MNPAPVVIDRHVYLDGEVVGYIQEESPGFWAYKPLIGEPWERLNFLAIPAFASSEAGLLRMLGVTS